MTDAQRFDEAAASWDEQPRRVQLAHAVAEAIVRQVPMSTDLDVLDFGCGTGLLALALRPLVRSVTGADTSRGMLEILEHKIRERQLEGVEIARLDPAAPLTLSRSFHLIASSMTLHHVPHLAPLFKFFHDHLHPGGRVALADLDREDGTFHEDAADVFHQGFDRSEIMALLAEAGFLDLEATTATVTQKEGRDYPVFLVTGHRGA